MPIPITVQCPWCFEWMELWIAPDDVGQMTQDCDVCCRPWSVFVWLDDDGEPMAQVQRED